MAEPELEIRWRRPRPGFFLFCLAVGVFSAYWAVWGVFKLFASVGDDGAFAIGFLVFTSAMTGVFTFGRIALDLALGWAKARIVSRRGGE